MPRGASGLLLFMLRFWEAQKSSGAGLGEAVRGRGGRHTLRVGSHKQAARRERHLRSASPLHSQAPGKGDSGSSRMGHPGLPHQAQRPSVCMFSGAYT